MSLLLCCVMCVYSGICTVTHCGDDDVPLVGYRASGREWQPQGVLADLSTTTKPEALLISSCLCKQMTH